MKKIVQMLMIDFCFMCSFESNEYKPKDLFIPENGDDHNRFISFYFGRNLFGAGMWRLNSFAHGFKMPNGSSALWRWTSKCLDLKKKTEEFLTFMNFTHVSNLWILFLNQGTVCAIIQNTRCASNIVHSFKKKNKSHN